MEDKTMYDDFFDLDKRLGISCSSIRHTTQEILNKAKGMIITRDKIIKNLEEHIEKLQRSL